MSAAQPLTPSIAANHIHKWLRAWHGGEAPDAVDLEVVRQMLPDTPYGQGVKVIKPPQALDIASCEGSLVRNPNDSAEWGIFFNPNARPMRKRFTVAHELGHFVLHRSQKFSFNCDKESVYSGADTVKGIEREADDFASNLLMPGDLLRAWMSNQTINLHLLSTIAQRFQVSFEALCIRFIKFTELRAILIYWDNGFLKYEWRSTSAIRTRARIRRNDDPAEPPSGTLAADVEVTQERDGLDMSAAIWCPEEAPHMKVREFKHSFTARDRVLTLLILERAEPRAWDRSWQDGESFDSYDQFVSNGQVPM